MTAAPVIGMILAILAALLLWSVGSYNAAVLMTAIAAVCGVVALVAGMSKQ